MAIVPQWSIFKIRSRPSFSPSQKNCFSQLNSFFRLVFTIFLFFTTIKLCHVSRHRDWSHFQGHFNIKVFLVLSPSYSYSSFPGQTTGTPIPARFPFLPRKLATGLTSELCNKKPKKRLSSVILQNNTEIRKTSQPCIDKNKFLDKFLAESI